MMRASFRAARSLVYETWSDVLEMLDKDEQPSVRQHTLIRLALTNVTHRYVAQLRRDEGQMFFLVHVEFGQEAVGHFDAALGEIAGEAEILAAFAAGGAVRVGAGSPDGNDHQIAWLDFGNLWPGLHHFGERFVAEDQVLEAIGRRTVLERNDFAVSTAHADIQHAHLRLSGRRELRLGVIDDANFVFAGEDGDSLHLIQNTRQARLAARLHHFPLDFRLV